jgi:hypothetical protein
MQTTQDHLPIQDIKDNIILLKDGGGALVLQVSAVNFGLLSQREQVAIIATFAQMLNSLSFSIQIVIHSERLNISSYLDLLDKARKAQINPLLSNLMESYRQFIQTTIKENDVLDKKFYIVIPLFGIEVGLTHSKESLWQKVKTTLLPRRDQVIRQLGRIGLNASQLNTKDLIKLFYNFYSDTQLEEQWIQNTQNKPIDVRLNNPNQKTSTTQPNVSPSIPLQPSQQPVYNPPIVDRTRNTKTHPFVVEELSDTI